MSAPQFGLTEADMFYTMELFNRGYYEPPTPTGADPEAGPAVEDSESASDAAAAGPVAGASGDPVIVEDSATGSAPAIGSSTPVSTEESAGEAAVKDSEDAAGDEEGENKDKDPRAAREARLAREMMADPQYVAGLIRVRAEDRRNRQGIPNRQQRVANREQGRRDLARLRASIAENQ